MTPGPKKPIPRVFAFLVSRQLGMAWVTAVILGAAVISSNPNVTPQRLVIPVVIMLAYGAFVFNRWAELFATASQAYKQSIVAQLADSMYFMGFVWTLWALIDSFVIHQIDAADAIFRTFGYALVTTASGMFCRLAILQFKYTATEQSHEAQESVEDLLLKFTSSVESTRHVLELWHKTLTAGTAAIGMANTGFVNAVEQARNELTATMTTATKDYLSMLATTQARLEQFFDATSKNLATTLHDEIADGLKDFGQQTAANLDQIREAAGGLAANLKRTNTSLGKSITDLTLKLTETTQQLSAASGTTTTATVGITFALNAMTNKLTTAATDFSKGMNNTAESVAAATHDMTQRMGGLAEEIKREITLGLDGITVTPRVAVTVDEAVVAAAVAPVRQGLQKISEQASGIQEALDSKLPAGVSADEILRRVEKTVDSAVATLTGRLENLQTEVHNLQGQERGVFGRLFGR